MTKDDKKSDLADVVYRNIDTLLQSRRNFERQKRLDHRIADAIGNFTGSMSFVIVHLVAIGGWLIHSPSSFASLSMIASVEAIFLTAFVFMNQKRISQHEEKRANLDLQINLLSEHEITRLIQLVDRIANHLGVQRKGTSEKELRGLKKHVSPVDVLEELEEAEKKQRGLP